MNYFDKIKFFFIIFLLPVYMYAQVAECDGYFIRKNSKDTIKALIVVPIDDAGKIEYRELQWKIKIKDKFALIDYDKEPSDLLAFGFIYQGKKHTYWSAPNPFDQNGPKPNVIYNHIFLRLRKSGYCKIFSGFTYEKGVRAADFVGGEDLILKANNKEWMVVRDSKFVEDMTFYFSDYPDLVKKVKDNVYTKKDLEKIVTEYNKFIAKKNKP